MKPIAQPRAAIAQYQLRHPLASRALPPFHAQASAVALIPVQRHFDHEHHAIPHQYPHDSHAPAAHELAADHHPESDQHRDLR